ncbi:hypothetical protein BN2537_2009 [Streptomyces venezuelae]|nr:hypothetical protein BN2537_2009 [Streptomyces venezuelae]
MGHGRAHRRARSTATAFPDVRTGPNRTDPAITALPPRIVALPTRLRPRLFAHPERERIP